MFSYAQRSRVFLGGVCAVALVVFVLSGCSEVRHARGGLTSPDPVVRAAAAESLGVWGITRAIPRLERLTRDTVPGVRARAYEALVRLQYEPADTMLVDAALRDPDASVRNCAAMALAECEPTSAAMLLTDYLDGSSETLKVRSLQALTTIAQIARDSLRIVAFTKSGWHMSGVVIASQEARTELPGNWQAWDAYSATELGGSIAPSDTGEVAADQAAIGLAWLGGEQSVPGLARVFSGVVPKAVLDSVLQVVAFRGDSTVLARLLEEVRTNVVSARRRATERLGGLPHITAEEKLVELADDRSNEVRREAWLSQLRIHGVSLDTTRPAPSFPLRQWSSGTIQKAAEASRSRSLGEALGAALVLVRAGEAGGVERLLDLISSERLRPRVACRALALVPSEAGDSQAERAAAFIRQRARSRDPETRAAAMQAMGRWRIPGAVELLRSALDDDDRAVQISALRTARLQLMRELLPEAMALLSSRDDDLRREAARTSAALVETSTVHQLALGVGSNDPYRRRGFVRAVGYAAAKVWATPEAATYGDKLSQGLTLMLLIAQNAARPEDRALAAWAVGYVKAYGVDDGLALASGDEYQ